MCLPCPVRSGSQGVRSRPMPRLSGRRRRVDLPADRPEPWIGEICCSDRPSFPRDPALPVVVLKNFARQASSGICRSADQSPRRDSHRWPAVPVGASRRGTREEGASPAPHATERPGRRAGPYWPSMPSSGTPVEGPRRPRSPRMNEPTRRRATPRRSRPQRCWRRRLRGRRARDLANGRCVSSPGQHQAHSVRQADRPGLRSRQAAARGHANPPQTPGVATEAGGGVRVGLNPRYC